MSSTTESRTATDAVEDAYARINADADTDGIFIELIDRDAALAAAQRVDAKVADGADQPLAGQTFAVKGNTDVAGYRTSAGCVSFGRVSERSATVVQRLEAAGAVPVAITNLDQFATGLVGTRSPYGICPNSRWPGLISGGSSSGSAVSVARGFVDFALGTDTAGSGRVPAAANGIVGVKPTRGRLPNTGVVPACVSIDCVSTFATSVEHAALIANVAAGFDPSDPWSRTAPIAVPRADRPIRIGVPLRGALTFGGDETGPSRFADGVAGLLAATGGESVAIELGPFLQAARLLYDGGFVAERYAAFGAFVDAHPGDVDPVVRNIIQAAKQLPAWQLARDIDRLARLRRETEPTWAAVDMIVVPTVPRIPTIDEVAADPINVNMALGTYTNFVNLLDLCAIALPVEAAASERPPFSITLVAPAWSDALLAQAAARKVNG